MSDDDDFDRFQPDDFGGDAFDGWDFGDIPDDQVQRAIDAFDVLGFDFDRDSITSMNDVEDFSQMRFIGYSSPIEALQYWFSDGWDNVPPFAHLIYDPYDDTWYWEVDRDTG